MTDKSIDGILEKYFSKSDKSDWKKKAMLEMQGKDPFEILSWRGKDEILFLPYYDPADVAHLQYLNGFQLPAAKNENAANRTWVNISSVKSIDETTANHLALNQLSLGAEGVVFDLRTHHQTEVNLLMKEIVWPYCTVSFYLDGLNTIPDALCDLIRNRFDPHSIRGALFWESIPKKTNLNFYFDRCQNFHALGLFIPGSTPATEISDALFNGVRMFETFVSQSTPERVFRSISFSLATDASFLESAAKLKVLRMLWFQVARAYGQDNYNLADLHVHARSEAVADGAYTPHENMLKGTFAAIAAITGGCDSLTIECQSEPPLIPRWAKNVSAILKEESFLHGVSDPLAGAYAYDSIVDSMAKKAWELFQLKCEKA
jgi:methylmalonyl-CoA mutase